MATKNLDAVLHIRFSPEVKIELEMYAEQIDRSFGWVVRDALAQYLKTAKEKDTKNAD